MSNTLDKILEIESQAVDSPSSVLYMYKCIELAKEAGYTEVHDNWAPRAYDSYSIDDALDKFRPKNNNSDLPF